MDKPNNITLKYLFFLFIGIFAFFFSGYALRGMHPPMNVLYGLLIFMLLFIIGLITVRNFSTEFILKAFAISFGVIFLIYASFFAWSAYSHSNANSIDAYELESAPDEFILVTQEELNEYPGLKRTIETKTYAKVSSGEFRRTLDFLDRNGTYNIKVGDEYYQILFASA